MSGPTQPSAIDAGGTRTGWTPSMERHYVPAHVVARLYHARRNKAEERAATDDPLRTTQPAMEER